MELKPPTKQNYYPDLTFKDSEGNQLEAVTSVIREKDRTFHNCDFMGLIEQAQEGDLIYCDPPYFGRYVDYYNGWTEKDEERLFTALSKTLAHFILSTWHHNDFRKNEMIDRYWSRFNVVTRDHFYHGGGRIENRHPMVETLVSNFDYREERIITEPSLF